MVLINLNLLCVLFLTYFQNANAIRCFDCTSVNNSMCLDLGSYDPATLAKYMDVVDCGGGYAARQQFFCRKIVQTILRKKRDPEVRVTRGCGWVPSRKECYKADNEDHLETVCQCFTDECNGGVTTSGAALAVFTALATLGLRGFIL